MWNIAGTTVLPAQAAVVFPVCTDFSWEDIMLHKEPLSESAVRSSHLISLRVPTIVEGTYGKLAEPKVGVAVHLLSPHATRAYFI